MIPQIENMISKHGNPIANQFNIIADEGRYFQSYSSIIAFIPADDRPTVLDVNKWDYSATTSKYRNDFLREYKKDTQRKIDNGTYILEDLNK